MRIYQSEIIRDPSEKQYDVWMVFVDVGRRGLEPCSPRFHSKGAAQAYQDILLNEYREPEFSRCA